MEIKRRFFRTVYPLNKSRIVSTYSAYSLSDCAVSVVKYIIYILHINIIYVKNIYNNYNSSKYPFLPAKGHLAPASLGIGDCHRTVCELVLDIDAHVQLTALLTS